ncbi:hypothetical protein, partial [Corynebacterium matruchotii]|uniref:hypothetical protein n=2 Tax=Corynebacterium matruchotii TaxID=43768 RepID=UPI003C7006BD
SNAHKTIINPPSGHPHITRITSAELELWAARAPLMGTESRKSSLGIAGPGRKGRVIRGSAVLMDN